MGGLSRNPSFQPDSYNKSLHRVGMMAIDEGRIQVVLNNPIEISFSGESPEQSQPLISARSSMLQSKR
jgi:hypothetical protein